MKTIPTLLTKTTQEFIDQMDLFQKYFDRIQLDIGDGDLVPNVTTQIDEMITLIENKTVRLLPNVAFDFHLMVRDYTTALTQIVALQELGMKVNICLINAGLHPNISTLSLKHTFAIGLDVWPKVTIDSLSHDKDLSLVSSIQIMTVNPGFQGSPFLEEMLEKIEQLRLQDYSGEIMIDGGVNSNTISVIQGKKYMPDFLCIGSYLTKAGSEFENRLINLKELETVK